MSDKMRAGARPWVVACVVAAAFLIFTSWILMRSNWDPTLFTAFGETSPITEYAEERVGSVHTRPGPGHDGRFYFVQANDPFLLSPDVNALVMDRPIYRSQRLGYPLLAGVFGLLGAKQVLWGLIVVNVVAMAFGAFFAASIAFDWGMSAWWGLAFPLNIGFVSEWLIDGAGILAGALALGGVWLIENRSVNSAIGILTAAALVREPTLLVAFGCAAWLWLRKERRPALKILFVPTGVTLLWAIYVRLQLDTGTGAGEIEELGVPFRGVLAASEHWLDDPLSLGVGSVLLILSVVFVARAMSLRPPMLLGFGFLGFALLGMFLSEQVWRNWFDVSRALAPVITAYILLAYNHSPSNSHPTHELLDST